MCECRAAASDVSSLCPCFIVENRSPVWLECMGYCLSLRHVSRFIQPCADFFQAFPQSGQAHYTRRTGQIFYKTAAGAFQPDLL